MQPNKDGPGLLVVSAGREGGFGCFELVKMIFQVNHYPGKAFLELDHKELYAELKNHWEKPTATNAFEERVKTIISKWPSGCAIVGNGYAHILGVILDVFGPDIPLVHLKRDRASWLQSFINNVKTYPWSHGNYIPSEKINIWRMCAPYFNEMTKNEWDALPLEEKAVWYYDKTHSLADDYFQKFTKSILISNKDLLNPQKIKELTRFINPDWIPPKDPVHVVNMSKIDFSKGPPDQSRALQRFYKPFDFIRFSRHPDRGVRFFTSRAMAGFKNKDVYDSNIFEREDLVRVKQVLLASVADIETVLDEDQNKWSLKDE